MSAETAYQNVAPIGPGLAPRGDRIGHAYQQLRDLIIWGRLAPGARIIETDVATRLGLSRTPVRSALHRLQQEGYIIASGTGPQARLSVAPLTKRDARELFAIVSHVEALAAEWAALLEDGPRERVVAELNSLNDALKVAATRPKPDEREFFELEQRFHRAFVKAAGGPRLTALHDAVKPQSERYVRLYVQALLARMADTVDEHGQLVGAIERGDAPAAKEAVMLDWHNATRYLSDVMERQGEIGIW
jgi:DNA-binding GntR family transcriptional regulator